MPSSCSSSSRSSSSFSSPTAHRIWLGPLLFSSAMFFRRNNQSLPKCSLPPSSCLFSLLLLLLSLFFHTCSCEVSRLLSENLFSFLVLQNVFFFQCVSIETVCSPPPFHEPGPFCLVWERSCLRKGLIWVCLLSKSQPCPSMAAGMLTFLPISHCTSSVLSRTVHRT